MKDRLLATGIIGTIVAALCCFTPLAVIILTLFGMTFVVGYLDAFLLPALFFFVVLTGVALWRRRASLWS